MTRIYNRGLQYAKILICLWWSITGFVPVAHSAVTMQPLIAWLNASRLPFAVQNAFRARFEADPQAREWLVAQEGHVYAIASQAFSQTTHAQVQQSIRGIVEMKARQLLVLYAAGEQYQQQGFNNREAIAKALTTVDTTVKSGFSTEPAESIYDARE